MTNIRFVLGVLRCLLILTPSYAQKQAPTPPTVLYTVREIGTIIDAGVGGHGYTPDFTINSHGDVAWRSDEDSKAYLWHNGKRVSLGDLARVTVREDGSVIGLRAVNTKNTIDYSRACYVVIWNQGKLTDLGPSPLPIENSEALSPQGIVSGTIDIAGSGDPKTRTPPKSHATYCKAGKLTDMGTLGGRHGVATGVNASGQVIGFSTPASDHAQHGFVWQHGKMRDLGTLPGFKDYAPIAINRKGTIVGWAFSFDDTVTHASTGPDHAFLWEHGAMHDLGTLGGQDSYAFAVNNSGVVVGTSDTLGSGQSPVAFMYEHGRMTNLNLLSHKVEIVSMFDVMHNFLRNAVAINDRGQIVAVGVRLNDSAPVFLLTPIVIRAPLPQ